MLTQFYDIFKNSYVQTFDDTKQNRAGFVKTFKMCDIAVYKKWLVDMNKTGMGVFFTPNPCQNGRTESDITAIDWVYVDMDEGTKAEMMEKIKNSPFYPHIITESSRSYHLFWRVIGMDKEIFSKIIAGLIDFYDGDPAISSTNEVLRLPPFYHMKDPKNPFQVQILRLDLSYEINANEMFEAYPEPVKKFQVKFNIADEDLDVLKKISITDVLNKLGVQVKRNFICDNNGKMSSASINVQGNYVNRFSGKAGSGSTIDVAMVYGNMDLKQAIEWLRTEFNLKKKEVVVVNKPMSVNEIMEEINAKTEMFTWGTPRLDRELTAIERHHFCVIAGLASAGKTAFAFDVAIKNAKLGHKVLFLSLEMSEKSILVRGARSFAGITKEEWRGRPKTIPEHKMQAYEYRAKRLTEEKNLFLKSMPKDVDPMIENIFTLIEAINPALTIIDNFDLIKKDPKNSEYLEQNRISEQIRSFCKDKNRPIILIHHENPHSKNKGLGAMRGSAKIGDNCDTQLSCSREWSVDASPEDNAKFFILANKDRDFGQWNMSTVYFKDGTFMDEYNQEKTTWHDKF